MEKLEDLKIEKKCPTCGESAYMNYKFDAVFCAKENKWLEPGCGDDKCEYCGNRPKKPLPLVL